MTAAEAATRPTILYAEFTALPGAAEEVAGRLAAYAISVQAEPGNLVFAARQKVDDPHQFFVYEEYRDDAGFQAHLAAEENATFNAALTPLVAGGGSSLTFLREV
jgi:quinol monooxygenase YgiN